jgi:3',5'-cyclic AMP phosphodiesterase CpdA
VLANKSKLNADAIVITGDLVDSGDDDAAYSRAKEFINTLLGAGYKVYSIPGNHDYSRWGLLGMGSESCRTNFHKLPRTSPGGKDGYPWVIPVGNETLILLDSMKAELDEKSYGATCVHPLHIGDYDMPLDPDSIHGCMGLDFIAPVALAVPKSGDQLSEGKLGAPQLEALSSRLAGLQDGRLNGAKVVVCLHHKPFDCDSSSQLDDADDFMARIKGQVDALLIGHATPDGTYWMDGKPPDNRNSTTPTNWETTWEIPIVDCVNLQHAGPRGFTPSDPAYPISLIDTSQNHIEVYFTDGRTITRSGLQPGSISGTITDSRTGTPVPNTYVTITVGSSPSPVASLYTDSNGVYSSGSLLPSTYTVAVPGYTGVTAPVTLVFGQAAVQNFAVPVTMPLLRGRVTDSQRGTPISGGLIGVFDFYAVGAAVAVATATTDANGEYKTFISGKTWCVNLNCVCPDYNSQPLYPAGNVTISGTGDTVFDFTLACTGSGTIRGTVLDDEGIALGGVNITASGGFFCKQVQATTDANGGYILSIANGGVNLSADLAGYESGQKPELILSPWSTLSESFVLLKLGVPATVTGLVTDKTGALVPGATVSTGSLTATAGADGSYTLTGVPSGVVTLEGSFNSPTAGQLTGASTATVVGNKTNTVNLKVTPYTPPLPCPSSADAPCPRAADVPCKAKPDQGGCTGKTPM